MSPATPLVSVIIPAYNAASFVGRTLASVSGQSYRNLEVLVVDDGSTDDTARIVDDVAGNDSRIRLLRQANAGVAAARNLALSNTRGDFVAPLDADDIWYPVAIEQMIRKILQSASDVGLVYAWSRDIDGNDAATAGFCVSKIQGEVLNTLVAHNFIGNASACLIRRACFARVGEFDGNLRAQGAQGCEDWDLYLRIAACYQFAVVPEFLVGYRKIPGSMSRDFQQMARSHCAVMHKVRQRHPNMAGFLFRFSSSNLYVYFANQSLQNGAETTALRWLVKAVRAEFWLPLSRIGCYRLLAVASLAYLRKTARRLLTTSGVDSPAAVGEDFPSRSSSPADARRQPAVTGKLLASSVLHKFINLIT